VIGPLAREASAVRWSSSVMVVASPRLVDSPADVLLNFLRPDQPVAVFFRMRAGTCWRPLARTVGEHNVTAQERAAGCEQLFSTILAKPGRVRPNRMNERPQGDFEKAAIEQPADSFLREPWDFLAQTRDGG